MAELPLGTVTLLFTDIEGSTVLVRQLGNAYGVLLDDHRRLLREAVQAEGGHEVECRADEFFAAFHRASDAVAAAVAAQRMIEAHTWPDGLALRVRMGLHTGEPAVDGGAYLGLDVHRTARICSVAHGGQILLSQTTRDIVGQSAGSRDLGAHSLAGLKDPERIFQLLVPGLPSDFPPLRTREPERGRLGALRIRRARRATIDQAAWYVRALLPTAAHELRAPLAELAAELFAADRATRRDAQTASWCRSTADGSPVSCLCSARCPSRRSMPRRRPSHS